MVLSLCLHGPFTDLARNFLLSFQRPFNDFARFLHCVCTVVSLSLHGPFTDLQAPFKEFARSFH